MTRVARLGGFVLVALVGGAASLPAQSDRGPQASVRVTSGPVITLDLPATDSAAFGAATGILAASGVRYGAEGPALDPTTPVIDLARPAERTITLTGLTVGDALEAIARAAPRLRWSESDGTIVVRMTNRDSLLDRRVQRFAVDAAPPSAILQALIRQLAPERVSADGLAGFQTMTPEVEARLPARAGRDVSIVVENVPLIDLLARISRENGAMTWVVTYARAPATIETATIVFRESGRLAVAGPAAPPPPPRLPGQPPPTDLRRLTLTADIVNTLTTYAEAARVPIGVERMPGLMVSGFARVPPLSVEGLSPRQAIAFIVAHDSRYEWTERDGRFVIRPTTAAAERPILDTLLPSFVRSQEPFEQVIAGFIARLGAEEARGLPMRPARQGVPAGTLDAARRKPISVSIRSAASARAVLDAICRAAGPVSWVLRDQPSSVGGQYTLAITSPDGWEYSRSFTLPMAAAEAPRPGAVRVPPELDRDIDRVPFHGGGPHPFLSLSSIARLPIGLELSPEDSPKKADPRLRVQEQRLPPLGPGRFSAALYALLDRMPGYALAISHGVLNIGPAGAAAPSDHFLDRPIGAFQVSAVPMTQVVARLRQRMAGSAAEPSSVRMTEGMPSIEQPITLDLDSATPRQVLNEIVKASGNVSWSIAYVSREPGRPPRAIEEDAVLTLVAHLGSMGRGVEFARDGSVTPPAAFAPSSVPPPPSPAPTGRTVLTLPLHERNLDSSVMGMCRALDLRCSMELVGVTVRSALGPPPPITARYDFAGLSGPDAMNKVVEFAPALAWTADGPVYRLRAQALSGAVNLPLDRRVDAIDRRIQRFGEIFDVIRSLLDPVGDATRPRPSIDVMSVGGAPPSSRDRPVELSLRNVTIRQILDEIARQHGALSWSVRYVDANGLYPELMLNLWTDNGGSGAGMRVR